jgi:microcystin-dependent protein
MKVLTGDGKTVYLPSPGHVDWFADDNVPEGYLACDGAAVSRETYANLFGVVGTIFGAGDGSKTFNVPDLRGKFVRGYLSGTSNYFGVEQSEGLPNITAGPVTVKNGGAGNPLVVTSGGGAIYMATRGAAAYFAPVAYEQQSYEIFFNANLSNTIYGASAHVTPVNMALLPCIKY